MSEETPERALTRVIDRQAHEIDRLRARVAELESERELALDLDSDNQEEVGMLHARVAELEGAIRAVQGNHWELKLGAKGCSTCAPQDGGWPCLVRLALDAVLPPEKQG